MSNIMNILQACYSEEEIEQYSGIIQKYINDHDEFQIIRVCKTISKPVPIKELISVLKHNCSAFVENLYVLVINVEESTLNEIHAYDKATIFNADAFSRWVNIYGKRELRNRELVNSEDEGNDKEWCDSQIKELLLEDNSECIREYFIKIDDKNKVRIISRYIYSGTINSEIARTSRLRLRESEYSSILRKLIYNQLERISNTENKEGAFALYSYGQATIPLVYEINDDKRQEVIFKYLKQHHAITSIDKRRKAALRECEKRYLEECDKISKRYRKSYMKLIQKIKSKE